MRHACHGANACVAAVQGGLLPQLSPDVVAAADAEDKQSRATRRKAGQRDHAGLAFVPAVDMPVDAVAPPEAAEAVVLR